MSADSKYVDESETSGPYAKRYTRRTYVANSNGDRIVVRAFVADDGAVLDRDGTRPTVKVIKRRLRLGTMELE